MNIITPSAPHVSVPAETKPLPTSASAQSFATPAVVQSPVISDAAKGAQLEKMKTSLDSVTQLALQALETQDFQGLIDPEEAIDALLLLVSKEEEYLHTLNQRVESVTDPIKLKKTQAKKENELRVVVDNLKEISEKTAATDPIKLEAELESIQAEKEKEVQVVNKMKEVFDKTKKYLECSICRETMSLPKVVGRCGHAVCQDCTNRLDEGAFEFMHASVANKIVVDRALTLKWRCPECRTHMFGKGLPVLMMKEIADAILNADFTTNNSGIGKIRTYKEYSPEEQRMQVRHLQSYARGELAQISVSNLLPLICVEQWNGGVYMTFNVTLGVVFFDEFAYTLDTQAGGVTVYKRGRSELYCKLPKNEQSEVEVPSLKEEKAQKIQELLCFADGALDQMNILQHTLASDFPHMKLIEELVKKANVVKELSEEAEKLFDAGAPGEVDPAIKAALEAKKTYGSTYAKLPGNMYIRVSIEGYFLTHLFPPLKKE